MPGHIRLRWMFAGSGTAVAAVFGVAGLWERNRILSQPFFNGSTWWDSTARFHVWPWPYKLAAICDMPAFIAGSILMLPIGLVWPVLPEAWDLFPSLAFAALLWYWVGSRLEKYSPMTCWSSVVAFCVVSLAGASIPMGYYTGWLLYGGLMWCIAPLFLRRSWASPKRAPGKQA